MDKTFWINLLAKKIYVEFAEIVCDFEEKKSQNQKLTVDMNYDPPKY